MLYMEYYHICCIVILIIIVIYWYKSCSRASHPAPPHPSLAHPIYLDDETKYTHQLESGDPYYNINKN